MPAFYAVTLEPNETRRTFASRHGSVAISPEDSVAFVRAVTDGDGADLVIEAVGQPKTLEAALALVRSGGRVVSVGAHATETWPLPLARCFADEISLRFAIGDSIRYRRKLFALIASGILAPADVIEARVSFANAPLAYERIATQQILKAVIDPRL